MSRPEEQRQHYDELVRSERPTRYGLSCGFRDRYDPALLERRPALRRALGRLFDKTLPSPLDTVLDLGCGTAYYWPLLAQRCERLIGVELSQAMAACGSRAHGLDESISSLGATIVCAEATQIPIESGSIDLVLVIDALHHCDDLAQVLGEVRRMLRPGGYFVAVEPNVINPVVFAAHLLPPEERGALVPNHPWAVRSALEATLDEVTVRPVTYVSGIQSERLLQMVESLEPLFERPPLSLVALRRIYRARRR